VQSEFPIKYSHLDIAGSAGDVPEDATGSPILALYSKFFNEHLNQLSDN
jgi:leucyl aminopeptidase